MICEQDENKEERLVNLEVYMNKFIKHRTKSWYDYGTHTRNSPNQKGMRTVSYNIERKSMNYRTNSPQSFKNNYYYKPLQFDSHKSVDNGAS